MRKMVPPWYFEKISVLTNVLYYQLCMDILITIHCWVVVLFIMLVLCYFLFQISMKKNQENKNNKQTKKDTKTTTNKRKRQLFKNKKTQTKNTQQKQPPKIIKQKTTTLKKTKNKTTNNYNKKVLGWEPSKLLELLYKPTV